MHALGAAFRNIAEERAAMTAIVEEVDDLIDMDINERRAENNIIYQKCLDISTSKYFNGFISLVIIANTVVLGLDKYPNDPKKMMLTDFFNFIFYVIFLLEMIIK